MNCIKNRKRTVRNTSQNVGPNHRIVYEWYENGKRRVFQVATTQGKQGIWLLTFPDRENREFTKFYFLHRQNCANTGEILKI